MLNARHGSTAKSRMETGNVGGSTLSSGKELAKEKSTGDRSLVSLSPIFSLLPASPLLPTY